MRILHIDETFHPSFGYQLNSLAKYQSLAGHEVTIFTTSEKKLHGAFKFANDNDKILEYDKEYEQKNNVKIVRLPVSRYISGRAIFKKGIFKEIDKFNPDVVMLHQAETYVSIMYILKGLYKKYPTVMDSHMLKMASGNKYKEIYNKVYKNIVARRINKNKIKVVRTQHDDYVNSVLGISKELTPFISFGSDLVLFHKDIEARKKFREENNIAEDAFVVVYTGKMDKAKGGLLLAQCLKEKFSDERDVVFVIVGNTYDDEYGRQVEKLFKESENRIIRFPTQKYVNLPQFYQSADLNVYARQCSLSFYDAQACGVPVVSEDNNINVERNSHSNGSCFKAENVESFREEIKKFILMGKEEYSDYAKNAQKFVNDNYNYEKIASKYTAIMEESINNFNK